MSKLPPLPSNLDEDLEAVKETVELNFKKCSHKEAKIVNNELRCMCGAAYVGPRLDLLQELFKERS